MEEVIKYWNLKEIKNYPMNDKQFTEGTKFYEFMGCTLYQTSHNKRINCVTILYVNEEMGFWNSIVCSLVTLKNNDFVTDHIMKELKKPPSHTQ